ncbi:unnamed protein product [Protopolystoma xenopodis]|uniref:Uncharacterized protein n=1 Tax=Protopolystoma xenopodis TaxID=117903 RepID=A0A448WCN3_9PLAT|nr:unnamed protein product [Protopolystoma xenopodis]
MKKLGESFKTSPRRHLDDYFKLWSHGKETFDDLMMFLSEMDAKVELTMDVEENGHLLFLDAEVIRSEENAVQKEITYRNKPYLQKNWVSKSHRKL